MLTVQQINFYFRKGVVSPNINIRKCISKCVQLNHLSFNKLVIMRSFGYYLIIEQIWNQFLSEIKDKKNISTIITESWKINFHFVGFQVMLFSYQRSSGDRRSYVDFVDSPLYLLSYSQPAVLVVLLGNPYLIHIYCPKFC